MKTLSEIVAAQLERAKAVRQTSDFLRQFVFTIVDRALRQRYGDNYSTRCLQSSFAIQTVLADLGISSRVWGGGVCIAAVTTGNPFQMGWHGFWDDDHHVWLTTEHLELVDLTISQLHLHPRSAGRDFESVPAIWWHPIDAWPPVVNYLPEGPVSPQLPAEEMSDLESLKRDVLKVKDEVVTTFSFEEVVAFQPILYGPEWWQALGETGHRWVRKTLEFQRQNVELPPWVAKKEQELLEKYSG